MTLQTCPCRKSASAPISYADCCQPYVEGKARAPSAEALMRSRYASFGVGAIDYLIGTVAPEARDDMERGPLEAWARESDWLGLDIVDTVDGQPGDTTGIVEFVAHFARNGTREEHHERSNFRFDESAQCWYFVDGARPRGKTIVKGAQPGRNDPCPCGSGKKYKKCCGAAA
jgi:SEC-C motif-containing protein